MSNEEKEIRHTDDLSIQHGDFVFGVCDSNHFIIPGWLEIAEISEGEQIYYVRNALDHVSKVRFYSKDPSMSAAFCLSHQQTIVHNRAIKSYQVDDKLLQVTKSFIGDLADKLKIPTP